MDPMRLARMIFEMLSTVVCIVRSCNVPLAHLDWYRRGVLLLITQNVNCDLLFKAPEGSRGLDSESRGLVGMAADLITVGDSISLC